MTAVLPDELTPADLPLAELNAARLDGEVFTLAGVWCPIDAFDGPETRAAAVAWAAPPRAVAERMTAAWIYGLVPEPARHQFCVDIAGRTRMPTDGTIHLREVKLSPADTVLIGRLPVTAPLRTAVDLARWGGAAGRPVETELLAGLLARTAGGDTHRAAGTVAQQLRGISFSRVAAVRLHQALRLLSVSAVRPGASAVADPVDVVDRVDPANGVEHPVQVGGVAHLEDEPADRQAVA